MADTLQKVQLPIVSDEGECSKKPKVALLLIIDMFSDCGLVYGEDRVAASMVCAGWPEGGKDSCQV